MKQWLNYFHPLTRLNRARQAYIKAHPELPDFLFALLTQRLPELKDNVTSFTYLAFDIETSGLNAKQDHILSIGCVTMTGKRIDLSSVSHTYIKGLVRPETAVINHIMPQMVNRAKKLDMVMEHLFKQMYGKLLLVHGKQVEQQFIDHYLMQKYNLPPMPLLWLDTLSIEKSMTLNKQNQQDGDYRLISVRRRYGLPDYNGHNASVDALATAELYLALCIKLFGNKPGEIKQVYRA
ncbi:MAG: 3'-5' exonuclease [Shewanella sp.]